VSETASLHNLRILGSFSYGMGWWKEGKTPVGSGSVDGMIILKCIFKKYVVKICSGMNRIKIGSNGMFFFFFLITNCEVP
jgi:hypothetical protein